MKKWIIFTLIAPLLMSATTCQNAYLESADKTSDDALLFDADEKANSNDWTGAINDINSMTAQGQAKRETKQALGSYYAGRCGLNLLNLAQKVKDGGINIWPMVMSYMAGATAAQLADCESAEATILSIDGTATNRTPDENILLVFIEMAKMGASLASSNADANHDGAIDGSFDACSTSDISDASIAQLGTGLTITLASLSAANSSIAGSISSTMNTLCTTLDTDLGVSGFCNQFAASDFTSKPPELLALRALIKSNELGFNTCGGPFGQDQTGTANDCICPVHP